jgi:Tol biopolymer transport system component
VNVTAGRAVYKNAERPEASGWGVATSLREIIAVDVKARGGRGRDLTRRMLYLPVMIAAAVAVACAVALSALSEKAEATFPGKNGDIVFTSRGHCADAAIVRVRPDGTGLTPLTCEPILHVYSQYPAWSADGKKIVFQNDADDADEFGRDLWVMDANGGNRVNITNTPNVDEWQPAWFPSGRKVAYVRVGVGGSAGYSAIEVLTLNDRYGSKVTKTSRLTEDGRFPVVSPNGKRVAFGSDRDGDAEIYVIRTDAREGPNNRPAKLTDNATYYDSQPDWSPDGSRIVYVSYRNSNNADDIFVMRADGSGKKRNLTRSPAREQYPAFSPDGKYIVFTSDRGGDQEIWKVRLDGTGLTQVTSDGLDNHQPDWQPRP